MKTNRNPYRSLAWAVFAVFLFSYGGYAVESRLVDDSSIAYAVEEELLSDEAVPFNDIDVRVVDGIVFLDGQVSNLLAKRRATRIAETVKGVRSVASRVDVKPFENLSPADLEQDLLLAFAADPVVESYEITASVSEPGLVILTGYVDSWQEKQFAESVAAGVRGVTAITNDIEVIPQTNRKDEEIRLEIEKRLAWNLLVEASLVEVAVDNGIVTLSGIVGSSAEKQQARLDSWVTGVRDVKAKELSVERWARDEDLRTGKYVTRDDLEIREAIEDAYAYDPRVFIFEIEPTVANGWVTLRGQVNNHRAKAAAVNIAENTVGVTGVTDRIKVRSENQPSDEELTTTLQGKLKRDPWLSLNDLEYVVRNGVVRLSGTVDDTFHKTHLDSVISSIEGVKEVKNFTHVADPESVVVYDPYVWAYYPYAWSYDAPYKREITADIYGLKKSDKEMARDIAEQLYWSPFVDHDDITVMVEDGVATLVGKVGSSKEKRAATENAIEGGATRVQNELLIDS